MKRLIVALTSCMALYQCGDAAPDPSLSELTKSDGGRSTTDDSDLNRGADHPSAHQPGAPSVPPRANPQPSESPSAPPPAPVPTELGQVPDFSKVGVGCGSGGISNRWLARQIYDNFFGPRMPKDEEGFGWHQDPGMVYKSFIDRVRFFPISGTTEALHDYFSFNPYLYKRTSAWGNWNIFGWFDPVKQPYAPYEQFNTTDYVPAAMTHYGRYTNGSTDIMADQLALRMKCFNKEMTDAFTRCPDCVDVLAMLSKHDLHKIFEVRFVRVRNGQLESSKPFRMISVDSSGDIKGHASYAQYPYLLWGGKWVKAKWRGEISGLMAHRLGTYGGPTAVFIRLSPQSPGY